MTLQLLLSEFPLIWGKFDLLFISALSLSIQNTVGEGVNGSGGEGGGKMASKNILI
jgi:hypothetical protein